MVSTRFSEFRTPHCPHSYPTIRAIKMQPLTLILVGFLLLCGVDGFTLTTVGNGRTVGKHKFREFQLFSTPPRQPRRMLKKVRPQQTDNIALISGVISLSFPISLRDEAGNDLVDLFQAGRMTRFHGIPPKVGH